MNQKLAVKLSEDGKPALYDATGNLLPHQESCMVACSPDNYLDVICRFKIPLIEGKQS